jgi:diguanylate cyclase (GGDEF)-like protein
VIVSELDADQAASTVQAGAIAEKIRLSLAQPYILVADPVADQNGRAGRIEHRCSVSIGVSLFRNQDERQGEILKRADAAMYQAKEAGRNQVRFSDAAGGVVA